MRIKILSVTALLMASVQAGVIKNSENNGDYADLANLSSSYISRYNNTRTNFGDFFNNIKKSISQARNNTSTQYGDFLGRLRNIGKNGGNKNTTVPITNPLKNLRDRLSAPKNNGSQRNVAVPTNNASQRNAVDAPQGRNGKVSNVNYGGSSAGLLDVYYKESEVNKSKPVVIFVHGGYWMAGSKNEYATMGPLLTSNNYVGVLISYVLYPNGNIDDMVDDVYQSILWTYNNISKYGGNPENIIVTGHSAGAHLVALTDVKASLNLENNKKKLSPLPGVQKLVLFNGPYDFSGYGAPGGISTSPTQLLRGYSDGSVKSLGAKTITIYSADEDDLVPPSSATNFVSQLKRVAPSVTVNNVFSEGEGFNHNKLIVGALTGNSALQKEFMRLINM